MFLPCKPCCGGGWCPPSPSLNSISMTVAGLAFENPAVCVGGGDMWNEGINYADGFNATYRMFKSGASEDCDFRHYQQTAWPTISGPNVYCYMRVSYNEALDRTNFTIQFFAGVVDVYIDGVAEFGRTYLPSDYTVFQNAFYYSTSFDLSSLSVRIDPDDGSGSTPCECWSFPGGAYQTSCLAVTGKSSPATPISSNATVMVGCSPYNADLCAGYNGLSTVNGYSWGTYGSDELELTIGDMTDGTITYPTAGTYYLPYAGDNVSQNAIDCLGGGNVEVWVPAVNRPIHSWAAAFDITSGAYTNYTLLLSVTIPLRCIGGSPAATRNTQVNATLRSDTGITAIQGRYIANADSYACSAFPSILGGSPTLATRDCGRFGSTTCEYSWSVDQA